MTRVLVCGHRSGLSSAMRALGVPFCVWHDRPVGWPGSAESVFVAPFSEGRLGVQAALERFGMGAPVTHVIAGVERAVVTASHARRLLGARQGPHTVALRCHDKLFMKKSLLGLGVPMTDFVDGNQAKDVPSLLEKLGSPVVVKERRASGGRGQALIFDPPEDPIPLRGKLAERFVDAPEVSVEAFVSRGKILFRNVTEYLRKGHVNVVPGRLPDGQREAVLELNRKTLQGLRVDWGLSHLECFLTDDGPIFGELGLRPPGGYIMELLALAYGFDAWRAFVQVELDRPPRLPDEPVAHAAAIILHPGPGRVARVSGAKEARQHPAVARLRIKVRTGDLVADRAGTGQDVGYVLLRAPDRPALLRAIEEVERMLILEMEPAGRNG